MRDLAKAHIEALLKPLAGGKRFTIASPEKFSYGLVGDIVSEEFEWGNGRVAKGESQVIDDSYDLDGLTAAKELGLTYRTFRETVKDFITQAIEMERNEIMI